MSISTSVRTDARHHRPPLHEPTPAEIAAAKEAIREQWRNPDYVDGQRVAKRIHPLTPRQKRLLSFYRDFLDQHGRQPTILELRDGLALGDINRVFRMLDSLRATGQLPRPTQPR